MQTLNNFIQEHKLKFRVEWADNNPNMTDDLWARSASHWKCTILGPQRRKLTIYFSQGSAHTREPELTDILDCLAAEASGVENARSFEEWCSEYGYDTDSRKAEKIFKACERQAEGLKRILGPEAYETLLYNTERL